MNENEIILSTENARLIEENLFLRDMLNRLIPIPINDDLKALEYNLSDLRKRVTKIEGKDNIANEY